MDPPKLSLVPPATMTPDEGAAFQAALSALFAAHPKAAEFFREDWQQRAAHRTASREGWSYLQMDPVIAREVSAWIKTHAKRKNDTREIWELILCHIDRRDGRVMLSRQQIAEQLNILPRDVSTCMAALAGAGALKRIEVGRTVVYSLNPHIGTKLARGAGQEARKAAAKPTLATENGARIEDARQAELEDALVGRMQQTGRLPWNLPE